MQHHTIFELRRYRLRPGARERLITLFDTEFVAPQDVLGMRVEGAFRDLADADAFVWVRSFKDMDARTQALQAFYSGPVWKEFGPAANETMLNSDNVLLLKPARGTQPFAHAPHGRRPPDSRDPRKITVATTCSLAPGSEEDFAALFREQALPLIQEAGARIEAVLITERSPNGFPRLPVREGETVLVWFESHGDEDSLADYRKRLSGNAEWTEKVYPRMDSLCWRAMDVACLRPTERFLRG